MKANTKQNVYSKVGLSSESTIMVPHKMRKATVEERRISIAERSVYVEGVKVLQKQERIGYVFTMIVSFVLVLVLFIALRVS